MAAFFIMSEQKPYIYVKPVNPDARHPCTRVWRALLWVGGALTFVRNFICNAVMVLILLFGFIACQTMQSFKDEAQAVFSGQNEISPASLQAKVLYLPLSGYISEMPFGTSQFDTLYRELNANLSGQRVHELLAIEKALTLAANDDDIQYVLLDVEGMGPISQSMAMRIGAKLQALQQAGKETAITATTYSQGAYLIAANAQHIYLDPLGSVDLKGIALSSLYYKELIDKLELTPYIFRAGHFKSAVEPYTRDEMSPDVKAQYQELAQGLWQNYVNGLQVRKAISRMEVLPEAAQYIAALEHYQGDVALMQQEMNLVDKLQSKNQLLQKLSGRFGQSQDDRFIPEMIDYRDYLTLFTKHPGPTKKIAIVYGVGNIVKHSQSTQEFSSDNLLPLLNDLGQDNDLKALVLYINSPGGMAEASEEIRRAIERLRDSGVKVVVSIQGMGASGAYWTATASDAILATKDSLVGSIGVFSLGVGVHQLLNNIGIHQDGVSTHEFAQMPVAQPLGPNMQKRYELSVAHTYKTFISLVSASRNLDASNYQTFAEGQVFLAPKAQQLGLVDKLGTLEDALNEAATLAGGTLDDYEVVQALPSQDKRLSAIENFIFRRVATYLPQEITQALLTMKQASLTADSNDTQMQIELLSPLQEPRI